MRHRKPRNDISVPGSMLWSALWLLSDMLSVSSVIFSAVSDSAVLAALTFGPAGQAIHVRRLYRHAW